MAKTLIFERSATVDAEEVEMKLFKTARGYSLERRIVEKDASASVQVLLIKSLVDLDRFANADPFSSHTRLFYNEVRWRLTDGE
jgi:hypothetical protein